jgi:hypothetical protein
MGGRERQLLAAALIQGRERFDDQINRYDELAPVWLDLR